MRRLRNDDGAIAPLIAIMAVVLFGIGALVIDVGRLYAERRQLQNGADAAAIAVATDCAKGRPCNQAANMPVAVSLANANSNDGASNVDSITYPTRKVTVVTSTRQDGATFIPHTLARVLTPTAGKTVHATATATWGGVGSATTIPLTFSRCEFLRFPPPTTPGAGTSQIIFHDGNSADPCSAGNSGGDAPGAFGYLDPQSTCRAFITAGGFVSTSTGNAVPNVCSSMFHNATQTIANTSVLIPIYDSVTGNGSNAVYHIYGFAEFYVTGWNLGGQHYFPPSNRPCNGSMRCLAGYFVRFVINDGTISPGAPDMGVYAVGFTD